MVSIDVYRNETNAHADYILPGTTMYEHEDFPVLSMGLYVQPFMQATRAVVPPAGEARNEWQVYEELARSVLPQRVATLLARVRSKGLGPQPQLMLDSLIRLGYAGDLWGLRRGLNFDSLLKHHPHGIKLADRPTTGQLHKVVRHRDRKVHLDHPEIQAEVRRLQSRRHDPDYPLHLIGLRELRSENSWMHNPPTLRAARPPHSARMHPDDAAALGLLNRSQVRLVSPWGAIQLPLLVTDEMSRGVVAVPHGWGHNGQGGWGNANREGGASVNDLMDTRPAGLDPLSGMSHLFGVKIRAEQVSLTTETTTPLTTTEVA
jgi:formate dehydrogenase